MFSKIRLRLLLKLTYVAIFSLLIHVHDTLSLHVFNPVGNISSLVHRTTRSVQTNHARQICSECNDPTVIGRCPRKTLNRIRRYTEKLKCQPEHTLIKIETPGPSYSIEPTLAKVKRCDGFCRIGFHSCLPVETSFVKVPVLLTNHRFGQTKCVEYGIEQHEKCACDCEILKEHCSHRHKHERCACSCLNEEDKYKCLESSDVVDSHRETVWNEETCKCECQPQECLLGDLWNSDACRCERITPDELENMLY